MNERAIPESFESNVRKWHLEGVPPRQIAEKLERLHGVEASHMAVVRCLKRMASETVEDDDEIYSEKDIDPKALTAGSPTELLTQLYRDMAMEARRARATRDRRGAIAAREAQVRIAVRLLARQTDCERMALKERMVCLAERLSPGVRDVGMAVDDHPPSALSAARDTAGELMETPEEAWDRQETIRAEIRKREAAEAASGVPGTTPAVEGWGTPCPPPPSVTPSVTSTVTPGISP